MTPKDPYFLILIPVITGYFHSLRVSLKNIFINYKG